MATDRRTRPSGFRFRRAKPRALRQQLSIFLAQLFSWWMWLTPPPIRTFIADSCGRLFYQLSTTYVHNVESNIEQVLGRDLTDADRRTHVQSVFRTSARNFMDLITMCRMSQRTFGKSVSVVRGDWRMIDDAIAAGTGVIFLTGHVGCFDFIGQVFWARNYPLTVVTGRTTSRFIFDGVTHLRRAHGARMVEPTPSGVRQVIRALRNGECAVFLSDRDFFMSGRPVRFFGRETTLPPGVVRIARDTGAVIFPVFTRRVARGKHELDILEPFHVRRTADLDADLDDGMRMVAQALEQGIANSLPQWVMFHRVWPEEPAPSMRVFPVGSPLESELLERVASALPDRAAASGARSRATGPEADEPETSTTGS